MEELQRQLRLALFIILIIFPVGIMGFSVLEGLQPFDSFWLTFVTLATIGYGDITARTIGGRIFTIVLVIFGLGALTAALQAFALLFISPELRAMRRRRAIHKKISHMRRHYIICGKGEIVDKTVGYVLQFAQSRRLALQEAAFRPIEHRIERVLGAKRGAALRHLLHKIFMLFSDHIARGQTLVDVVVVITMDTAYARHLESAGLSVIEGNPTDADVLRLAGIAHARSLTAILDDDTETLLTVLTARHLNPALPITAGVLEEELSQKMIRVGANYIITPYDVASQFLNNATLRPAVNDYFNSLLFDVETPYRLTQIDIVEDSPWVGQTIQNLRLREQYDAGLIGLRRTDGTFLYAPSAAHRVEEDEVLIFVAPPPDIQPLIESAKGRIPTNHVITNFQMLHYVAPPPKSGRVMTLESSDRAVTALSQHFIICGTDRVARSAIDRLNPERPFVILSDDEALTRDLLLRGFHVVHGDCRQEATLIRAGVRRASAIMVSNADKAGAILTVLACRTLNKRLLITATAFADDMVDKLERAGADRVVSPFHVAARFLLLSSTRPDVSDFINAIIYNYATGLETTELYMETSSPWIGKTLASLNLFERFEAGVIGLRQPDKHTYLYAPASETIIEPEHVLIVVTPMQHSDALREMAQGSTKRPDTLRRAPILQSGQWSRDILKEMIEQRGG